MGDAVSWYKWTTIAAFDAWHDEVKTALGYPIPAVNVDGEPTDGQPTTEYTAVISVTSSDHRAWVDDEVATISEKIGSLSQQPIMKRDDDAAID